VQFKEDVAIMSLDGQFVAGGDGPFLRQKVKDLVDAGVQKLILDFTGVPYIDSTGLGFLAGSRVTAEGAGARMVLAGINQHVRRILDEVRLSQFFLIAKDENAAMAKMKEPAPPRSGAEPPPAKESKPRKRPRASAE